MRKYRFLLLIVMFLLPTLARTETLLVIGDSISAGYGLDKIESGWVSLLSEKLKPRGIQIINASISGDTSAGGLARMDELMKRHHPAIVMIELGGNDGLRGLTPAEMESNLDGMVKRAKQASAQTVLLGMKMPPNYGARYASLFEKVYADVARKEQITLIPFLLQGVGGNPELMQTDGIHPNKRAQAIIAEHVLKTLEPMLKESKSSKPVKK